MRKKQDPFYKVGYFDNQAEYRYEYFDNHESATKFAKKHKGVIFKRLKVYSDWKTLKRIINATK